MPQTSLPKPKLPSRITPESVERYKKELRRYDESRMAAGVSRSEVQCENSALPPSRIRTKLSKLAY